MNENLRQYVTRVGFNISLTKAQIQELVFMDVVRDKRVRWLSGAPNFIVTGAALRRRGLLADDGLAFTHAGELVVELLKEAGIYTDILDGLTVWNVGTPPIPLRDALAELGEEIG